MDKDNHSKIEKTGMDHRADFFETLYLANYRDLTLTKQYMLLAD